MSDDASVESTEPVSTALDPEDDEGFGGIIPVMALSIPLIAVGIPFLGVAGGLGLGGVVLGTAGAVVVLAVAANLAKGVLRYRHRQRMAELGLQLELARQETAKLAEIDRVVGQPTLGQ
ncbi:MAG: hypothetical protein AAF547_02875 [Actinomycetota bacterium]